jgi:hypothetical protein
MMFSMRFRWAQMILPVGLVVACASAPASAQEAAAPEATLPSTSIGPNDPAPKPPVSQAPPDKRVLGVLPNYRTANESAVYTPISLRQKFVIASKDSFDYPLVFLAGALAGVGQLSDQNPAFGQGVAGYARRLGTAYGDQAIGNMMTEGIFPAFLREDPRYFRRGYGSKRSRAFYALTRVLVTRTDAGGTRFNFSEVLGNATGVAISNAYYPEGRTVVNNVAKLGEQIGTDAISQVLKEFWPDIKRKFFRRHESETEALAGSAFR